MENWQEEMTMFFKVSGEEKRIEDFKPADEIERLQNINAKLLEEHKHWAKIQGRIIVEGLQGDFKYLRVIAQTARIEYINGEPYLKSEAIEKAERRDEG